MAIQTYLIAFKREFSQDMSRSVQHRVKQRGGFILMVAGRRALATGSGRAVR